MKLLAYLDPGSASALLAAVLAGIASAGAVLRTWGRKLMFWKKDDPATKDVTATTAGSTTNTPAAAVPADSTDDKPSEQ